MPLKRRQPDFFEPGIEDVQYDIVLRPYDAHLGDAQCEIDSDDDVPLMTKYIEGSRKRICRVAGMKGGVHIDEVGISDDDSEYLADMFETMSVDEDGGVGLGEPMDVSAAYDGCAGGCCADCDQISGVILRPPQGLDSTSHRATVITPSQAQARSKHLKQHREQDFTSPRAPSIGQNSTSLGEAVITRLEIQTHSRRMEQLQNPVASLWITGITRPQAQRSSPRKEQRQALDFVVPQVTVIRQSSISLRITVTNSAQALSLSLHMEQRESLDLSRQATDIRKNFNSFQATLTLSSPRME